MEAKWRAAYTASGPFPDDDNERWATIRKLDESLRKPALVAAAIGNLAAEHRALSLQLKLHRAHNRTIGEVLALATTHTYLAAEAGDSSPPAVGKVQEPEWKKPGMQHPARLTCASSDVLALHRALNDRAFRMGMSQNKANRNALPDEQIFDDALWPAPLLGEKSWEADLQSVLLSVRAYVSTCVQRCVRTCVCGRVYRRAPQKGSAT